MAFYLIEPFGEYRADLRNAMLCSLIANVNKGKKQRPFKMKDFMLRFESPKQQSDEDMKAVLKAYCAGF